MKSSPTLWLAIGILLGGAVGGATAVWAQSEGSVKPMDVQSGSSCESHAVKHLLVATDSAKRVDQEWNLNAAKAYRELAAMGFREC